jgi:hypothetical protein
MIPRSRPLFATAATLKDLETRVVKTKVVICKGQLRVSSIDTVRHKRVRRGIPYVSRSTVLTVIRIFRRRPGVVDRLWYRVSTVVFPDSREGRLVSFVGLTLYTVEA